MAVSLPGRHTPCASFAALGVTFLVATQQFCRFAAFLGGKAAF